jgi:polar amino acid transport system substrate-binding protein
VSRSVPALGLVLVLLTCGCTGQVGATRLVGPAPSVSTAPAAAGASCADPTGSLRPQGPLPAPGTMPAGSFVRAVQDRGRLVAGVSGDRLLFGYLDPLNNRLEGLEIDLLEQLSKAIFGDEDHLQLRVVTESEAVPLLQRGSVDVVARGLAIPCAPSPDVEFSTEYYHAAQRVLVASNSPARGIDDVRGKHVCAAAGSAELANVASAPSRPIPVAAPDWTECMVLFQQGQVDAISADDATLLGFTLQDPYARIVGGTMADEPFGLAVARAHPDLVRFVNGALEQMRADGRLAALYDRWLGRFGPAPPPPAARYRD